jgi:CheY-like chemotaxis protein
MNKLNRVYIIDDDGVDRLIAQLHFNQVIPTADVFLFSSATAALKQIELSQSNTLPELILLDINMPLVDGWQFLDTYQSLTSSSFQRSIIYLLSSSTHFLDQEKAITYQVVEDLISKPFSANRLKQIIHKHFSHGPT